MVVHYEVMHNIIRPHPLDIVMHAHTIEKLRLCKVQSCLAAFQRQDTIPATQSSEKGSDKNSGDHE